MTDEEKLRAIEEAMAVKKGTLKPTDLLEKYKEWDSLAALSLLAYAEKKINKIFKEKELRNCKTVLELMDLF